MLTYEQPPSKAHRIAWVVILAIFGLVAAAGIARVVADFNSQEATQTH